MESEEIQLFNSNLADVKCQEPQGPLLGPNLLLMYTDDLHLAIKYSEVYHFADDANLLIFSSCVNSFNK